MLSCACKIILMQESERVVSKKEGIDFAREYGCLFLECSAKTRVNVEQCFEELVLKVHIVEALFVFFKTFLHLHLFWKKVILLAAKMGPSSYSFCKEVPQRQKARLELFKA